jgi:capsular exopolysaccharide synthesis family protein
VRPTNPYYEGLLRLVHSAAGRGGSRESPPLTIGVTSSTAGEGVSTIAVNLAAAAAASTDSRVLLVDANSARPALHRLFKIAASQQGLLNVLAGQLEPFACAKETSLEKLALLPCGSLEPGLSPSYEPAVVEEAIDQIKHVFPLTIFDLPPAHELTPCCALAAQLDGVLLVVEEGRIDRQTLLHAKQCLLVSNAKILGIVINKSRDESQRLEQ